MTKGLIIDAFAGGGGASVGIRNALGREIDIAVNHDPQAIRMHKVNHPDTIHLTEDIFEVDLKKYVGDKKVDLMCASPTCTDYSKAKGGQPRDYGLRILPWAVYKHAKEILPEIIFMENVEEIQKWGPLDENGRQIKSRLGEEYERFISSMKALGYKFDSRELVAADYGAPTTRKRWYAVFRKDGREIVWPTPTHSKTGEDGRKKWLECGDYIDWSDLGKSIYHRKKPLVEATMRRIINGCEKYIVNNPDPYVVNNKEVDAFLNQRCLNYEVPIDSSCLDNHDRKFISNQIYNTIQINPGCSAVVNAFLIKYYGTGCGQELNEPLATITTKDRFGLVSVVSEVSGDYYRMCKNIFLRMLKPEELKMLQGFPEDYVIDHDIDGRSYPIKEQVARIGNSVVPIMAEKIVRVNCPHLIEK